MLDIILILVILILTVLNIKEYILVRSYLLLINKNKELLQEESQLKEKYQFIKDLY